MKRFLLLYSGPPAPPGSSHEGWPEWFENLGDALVDVGSPMANGVVVNVEGSTSDETLPLRGYSLIQAENRGEALELLGDHPLLALGREYTIEMFEVPKK
jgi:hypothetical protein